MRNFSILVLVFLGNCIFLMSEPFNFGNADSFPELIRNEQDLTKKVKLYLQLADAKLEQFDNNSFKYIDTASNLAKQIQNKLLVADCDYQYARYWKYFDNYELAINKLFEALSEYEELKNDNKIAETYRFLGETFRGSLNYNFSIKYLHQALTLFLQTKNQYGLARTYNRFAAVFYEMQFSEQTNKYLFDSVNYYYYKSQKIAIEKKWNDLIVSNYNIKGAHYRNYTNYDSAIYYLVLAEKVAKQNNLVIDLPMICLNLGDIYEKQNKLDLALSNIYKGYYLGEKYQIYSYCQSGAGALVAIYKKLGNKDSVIKYALLRGDFYAKIHNMTTNSKLINKEYKYKTEKDELILKNKEKIFIYERVTFSFAVFLVILILFVIYKRYRNVQSVNELLQSKNNTITEQRELLLELNKTKDKFFSIVSHDLKNPIGAFKNSLDLAYSIFDDFTKEELKELLYELNQSAKSLYNFLEDLLNWSRSQRGVIRFEPTDINLYSLCNRILDFLNDSAKQKQISINVNIDKELNIVGDVYLLHTVIRNIISNSIKFSNANGIIEINYDNDGKNNIISIKDNGVGISHKDLDRLFKIEDNFTSVGTNGEKGTGLGLILCKEFMEKHSGNLEVKSEFGKGTEILLSFPDSY